MKMRIITAIILIVLCISVLVPMVSSANDDGWKGISIKGKCYSLGFGGFFGHFFCIWYTPHTLNFKMKEGCEVKVNGALVPINWRPDIELHGFIGRGIWPYSWTIKSKQDMLPPYDIIVFGVTKHIDIL